MKKLYALRGATQCINTTEDICKQIGIMYDELLNKNNLEESDIVSVIFSMTNDLDAINPSTALRKYKGVKITDLVFALFSVQEVECKDSLEKTIRVIIHCYLEENSKVNNVYRNGAEVLI
jgi:chorismate mutase